MTKVSLDAALDAVLARATPLPAEDVPLAAAVGRVLVEDVRAQEDRPTAAESAMDGYAVCSSDVAQAPVALRLAGESQAGSPMMGVLPMGQVARISTGALLPDGADAVVRQEDTEPAPDGAITIAVTVPSGYDVRQPGEDWRAGDVLLAAGTQVTPEALAPLAGAGAATIRAARRPRVAVLATGDELAGVGDVLPPGWVRETSTTTLPAILARAGAETVWSAIARDDPADLDRALHLALAAAPDLILVCGGASVGPHDIVRPAVAQHGFSEVFGRVLVKPGGPAWCAHREGGPLLLGLPGNPVASVVVTHLLAVPAVARMLGADVPVREVTATLTTPARGAGPRLHAARGRLTAGANGWELEVLTKQGSHQLTSLVEVNALALVPPGTDTPLQPGDTVTARLL
ncbi:molybdopterin molybdotransferase MoeA [Svornostia abyssi]|uniref:Molybdopterin molybdenumtransferase n=1 Tax=Svornostia abyssi TaxID=2898438 RepID=A0ABY5PKR8_9ACTN|nr:molybdopterin molybdotransferase MoeA [Parviterribacteraceae bacterium J379]